MPAPHNTAPTILTSTKKMDSSTDTDDLSTTDIEVSVLTGINKLDLLAEIKDLRCSLDFAHSHTTAFQPRLTDTLLVTRPTNANSD